VWSQYELLVGFSARQHTCLYTVSQKGDTILLSISLLNIDRFSQSFTDVLSWNCAIKLLIKIPPHGGIKQGWGGENKLFSSFKRQYLEKCRRCTSIVRYVTVND